MPGCNQRPRRHCNAKGRTTIQLAAQRPQQNPPSARCILSCKHGFCSLWRPKTGFKPVAYPVFVLGAPSPSRVRACVCRLLAAASFKPSLPMQKKIIITWSPRAVLSFLTPTLHLALYYTYSIRNNYRIIDMLGTSVFFHRSEVAPL